MLYFCSWYFFNKPWKLGTVMTEWSQDQGAQKEKDHADEQPAPSSTRHQDWDHLQGLKNECIRRPWRGHWIRWISTAQKHVHMNSIGHRTPHRWAIGRWGVGRESTQIYAFVLNSSSCVPLTIIFKVEDGWQMTMVSSGFPRKSCKRYWPRPERVFNFFSTRTCPRKNKPRNHETEVCSGCVCVWDRERVCIEPAKFMVDIRYDHVHLHKCVDMDCRCGFASGFWLRSYMERCYFAASITSHIKVRSKISKVVNSSVCHAGFLWISI